MSYVIVGDNIVVDSEEILKKIKEEFKFKEIKDITKASNRDDTLIYQVIQEVERIKEEIDLENLGETLTEEELVEELMAIADENILCVEDIIPEGFISHGYSYRYDEGLDEIKSVFVAIDEVVGEKKLMDVVNRILNSID